MFYWTFLISILQLVTYCSSHTRNTDDIAYFAAYMPTGSYCNKQLPITNWITIFDRYRPSSGGVQNNQYFINGVYTTPAAGVYQCCASFRCQQRGVCDFTFVRNAGAGDVVYGAFGTRNTIHDSNGWASHSQCITSRSLAGVTFKVNLESGGGNDCIEETGWRYNKFSCYLASAR